MGRKAARRMTTKPTASVLRGLYALVSLGSADLEGSEDDWVGPKGTFDDTSMADVENAKAWLHQARAVHGLGAAPATPHHPKERT